MKKNILFILLLIAINTFADDTYDYSKFFDPTPPPVPPVRSIAEFEPMEAVIVRFPLEIPASLVAEMSEDIKVISVISYAAMQNVAEQEYSIAGANMQNCSFFVAPNNSEWARDWGPWFVFNADNELAVVDYPYNRDRPLDDDFPITYAQNFGHDLYGMDIVHTGGNYMTDGLGIAASTDLVYTENSDLSVQQINQAFTDYLGINTYHVTIDPQDDYIKHIDCWAKFLSVDKILIGQVAENDPRYNYYEEVADYYENQVSSWGTPYKIYRVFTPGYGNQITPYTNSLILNTRVFVPQTGSQYDDEAIAVYEQAMPGYEIIGIDYDYWYNTDALHCRTHEVPDDEMIFINHTPVALQQDFVNEIEISAYIYAYSGANIAYGYPKLYYSEDNQNWNSTQMQITGNENTYAATLQNLTPLANYSYYIEVIDTNGKQATHPFIGSADAHKFSITPNQGVPVINFDNPFDINVNSTYFPALINCSVDYQGSINSVKLEYTINDLEVLYTLEMENTDQNNYSVNFNPELFNNDEVNYRILVNYGANYTTQTPNYSFTYLQTNASQNTYGQVKLLGNYPNPFNPTTNIRYYLSKKQNIELSIYDVKGRKVTTLYKGISEKGEQSKVWNGYNAEMQVVASGVYFVKLKTANKTVHQKIMLLK